MFLLNRKFENGEIRRTRIDDADEVTYSTFCGFCDVEIELDEGEFYEVAAKDGYHGSVWYCGGGCADEARALREVMA